MAHRQKEFLQGSERRMYWKNMKMSSRKMNEAELQKRMDIYFPATPGKQCHMQIRVHKTMQEGLDSINICQTMREVVLISKKTPKTHQTKPRH